MSATPTPAIGPTHPVAGARGPVRLARGLVAVGAITSCLTFVGGTAFASVTAGAPPAAVATTATGSTAAGPTSVESIAQRAIAAFYGAGYTYTEGLDLAVLWGSSTAHDAKVTAGTKLLDHVALPFAPGHAPTTWTTEQEAAAWFADGRDLTDLTQLAVVWLGEGDTAEAPPKTGDGAFYDVKVAAGTRLLAGEQLPSVPKTFTDDQDVSAFLLWGGDYQEALQLAAVWSSPSVGSAKVAAGSKHLAGEDLPKIPATFTRAQDVAAFRAAGYDRADARALAHLWHSRSVHAAKVTAGSKLLAGLELPIAP